MATSLEVEANQDLDKILACNVCNKYFINPVSLPCGSSVCKEHVVLVPNEHQPMMQNNEHQPMVYNYKCHVCHQDHKTLEDGFPLNGGLIDLLKLNLHLDQQTLKEMKLINEYETVLIDISLLCKDPYNYVFKYVSAIRNKIDLRREKIIERAHLLSDEMLNKLKVFEDECKGNLKNLNDLISQNQTEMKIYEKKSEEWREKLRTPKLDKQKVNEMIKETDNCLIEKKAMCLSIKNKLLIEKECFFEPKDFLFSETDFGLFNMKERDEATFQFVISEFSKFKESKHSSVSPNVCMFRGLPWKILARHEKDNDFGFYLQCNTDDKSKTWSVTAEGELRLLHLNDLKKNFVRKLPSHLYNFKENDWGFKNFFRMKKFCDPKKGYYDVERDCITLEVWLKADAEQNQK